MNLHQNNYKGMTMIEILITLGIVSVLFASFFYVWNTMDIFRKSRDSKRINDLQVIDTALKTILATEGNINLGQENIIYTSLPDSSSTCGSYNLVPVFSPFSYHCQPLTDYLKVDGNGWIPISFTLGKVLIITVLPVDPLNNKDYFYAYQVKQGRYKLTARFESKTNITTMVNDGGFEPTLYEVGSDLFIPSPHSGLVGYWSFDEATGTISYDLSGYGNNGLMYSATNPINLHSTSSCKIGSCANFDGVDDYVDLPDGFANFTRGLTIMVWAYPTTTGFWARFIDFGNGSNNNNILFARSHSLDNLTYEVYNYSSSGGKVTAIGAITNNEWHYYVATEDAFGNVKIYKNGVQVASGITAVPNNVTRVNNYIGRSNWGVDAYYAGKIDEVRVYNRALSDSEIKALYEATK